MSSDYNEPPPPLSSVIIATPSATPQYPSQQQQQQPTFSYSGSGDAHLSGGVAYPGPSQMHHGYGHPPPPPPTHLSSPPILGYNTVPFEQQHQMNHSMGYQAMPPPPLMAPYEMNMPQHSQQPTVYQQMYSPQMHESQHSMYHAAPGSSPRVYPIHRNYSNPILSAAAGSSPSNDYMKKSPMNMHTPMPMEASIPHPPNDTEHGAGTLMPPSEPRAMSRPAAIRHRSKSVTMGHTLRYPTPSGGSDGRPTPSTVAVSQCCAQCGMNLQAMKEQMMVHERRKLDLMNEKIEVDQALFHQEKKNFKRRLQALKLSMKKSQQGLAAKERQRQLDWIKFQKDLEEQFQEKLRKQQQEYELKLLETESSTSLQYSEHSSTVAAMEATIRQLQEELNAISVDRHEQEALVQQLQEKLNYAPASAIQENRMEQLQRDLEDKQTQLESLEMQLLELERERDAAGMLRGSGGSTVVVANTGVGASGSGGATVSLDRQLSDAMLQIDTLQNRQCVTDQKLSQERRKYEELRQKMDALEASVSADREHNDQRLRMSKDIKDLQQQLHEAKLREQEFKQQRKSLEQTVIQTQEENENLEEKLSETKTSLDILQKVYNEAKERADVACAIASATQRAVEDNGTSQQPIDVLSGCVTASTVDSTVTPSTTITSLAEGVAAVAVSASNTVNDENTEGDANRRNVMEYEWHGAQYSGIYTGQLSVISNNPDGDGTLRLDDGAVYNGEWRNGQPHGSGVWATIEGDLFCSQSWQNGTKHGKTVDVFCDGCVYRGNYEYGKRHGDGILTWPYGANYVGQFMNDKRNGTGVYTYADGRCYTGTYKDDRPHGYGKMTTSDGTALYDGMWQLGEFIGSNDKDEK
jgi:hypothetical protein